MIPYHLNQNVKIILGLVALALIAGGIIVMRNRNQSWGSTNKATWPLDRAEQRHKLLRFGMYVTPDPEQNPIDPPERFTGFHTALDFEILPGEENQSVVVKTICPGKLLHAGTVEGYGGVIVQVCNLQNKDATVLYGHLDPATFKVSVNGQVIPQGIVIGELGAARTSATDGSRKHLHLGIHKGTAIEFKGYVPTAEELKNYIDPETIF